MLKTRETSFGVMWYSILDVVALTKKEMVLKSFSHAHAITARQRLYKFRDVVRRRELGQIVHKWDCVRVLILRDEQNGEHYNLLVTTDDLFYRGITVVDPESGASCTIEEHMEAWAAQQPTNGTTVKEEPQVDPLHQRMLKIISRSAVQTGAAKDSGIKVLEVVKNESVVQPGEDPFGEEGAA